MIKYYTRACNFFYGSESKKLVKKNFSLPIGGDNRISFNQIELFSRNKKKVKSKIYNIKDIRNLSSKKKRKSLKI